MANIKLIVEYDGTSYHGFQRQEKHVSVQEMIEKALSRVYLKPIEIDYAGRTDGGVHASGMAVNFRAENSIDLGNLPRVIDEYLPEDIGIKKAEYVDEDFHARFSAKAKRYRYIILNERYRSPLWRNRACHVPFALDELKMREALQYLLGEHDFASFMGRRANVHTTVRSIESIEVIRDGKFIYADFVAKSFLKNQIRIIMGSAIEIGRGRLDPSYMKEALESKSRLMTGPTAPACGLYLTEVYYD